MRLTQEIDYGFRIVSFLCAHPGQVIGAPIISKELTIPERFTLRILRKLNLAGITDAKRGAHGGYYLKADRDKVTMYDVIEALDGPIIINRCLDEEHPYCNRNDEAGMACCNFHNTLNRIQGDIVDEFKSVKIKDCI